ncbi:MAG: bifunctional diaminohydroxyphosphoribosylaminopyrimidine deaminase/5-amino-6-(5-phosphoribosylamino)uracil reductase RibD [Dehalococcoidia bacterium]|nr:bifunctional diaminohydroxyphosphoribosylaminopyrimidine deaminase/5-amino-6-(5-phosphoribosylamino)uracil reductase RibD [Dehalococcoidia bacterium]
MRKVHVAIEDPDRRVRGRGIAALREAGVEVELGDGREAVLRSLRPYLKHRETGLPYVVAKFAASLDGRTAANSGDSKWITGEAARERVHRERARCDAILAGSGTVLADDPALTARPGGVEATHQPVRIVLDARGRIDPAAQVFRGPGHCIVAAGQGAAREWKQAIQEAGATVLECEHDQDGVNLDQLLRTLGQRGIISAWVEGGATLLGSLFDGGHVDEVWAFVAPRIIGGTGRPAVGGRGIDRVAEAHALREVTVEQVGEDVLVRGYTGRRDPGDGL